MNDKVMLRPLASFVLLLAPAVLSAQTDPALLRFIPPNPKALISVDWKTLKSTHIGALLRAKYIDGDSSSAIPGVEYLDDVDRFIVTSPGTARADEASEPPMLVVVRGHFDLAKVRKTLAEHGARPQMFNSLQVYRPQGKNSRDMAFVLIDAQTILIGDANSVFAGLERNANPTPPDGGPILVRAKELDSRYDVWAILSGMQSIANDRLMGLLAGGGLQSDSRSFEAGISLKNGLVADISLIFPSEPEARSMVSEFSKLMKAAIKDKVGGPAMVDFEKRLKVAADGATAKISLRMTPQEFEKNAQLFAAARQQQAVAAAEVKPPAEAVPAAPKAAPQMIKIDGLDDGPREIRLKPDQR
jgi:5-deoxy-D-glucuronate isomerase